MSSKTQLPRRMSAAMVMANGLATPYRRWGSGPTVLLLGTSEATAIALGASFRVIVPALPLGFSELRTAEWLGGVYEGLGIIEAAIVATPELAAAAWQLREEAPERVRGIVIVDISTPGSTPLRTTRPQSGVQILVVESMKSRIFVTAPSDATWCVLSV